MVVCTYICDSHCIFIKNQAVDNNCHCLYTCTRSYIKIFPFQMFLAVGFPGRQSETIYQSAHLTNRKHNNILKSTFSELCKLINCLQKSEQHSFKKYWKNIYSRTTVGPVALLGTFIFPADIWGFDLSFFILLLLRHT